MVDNPPNIATTSARTGRIPRDLWEWRAVYTDNSSLDEYDDRGNGRGFAEIDQSRLAHFLLLPQVEGLPTHALEPTEGRRPIFFRRRSREMNVETGDTVRESAVHILGWQDTVNGKNVQSFTYFLPNGNVLVSDHSEAI